MVKCSRRLARVAHSARSIRCRRSAGNLDRSPTKRSRTCLRFNSSTSSVSTPRIRSSSNLTSRFGRCQFSVLKAKRVRNSTPRSAHACATSFRFLAPARCPDAPGRCRDRAQRWLPSMTIARCRGGGPGTSRLGKPSINLSRAAIAPSLVGSEMPSRHSTSIQPAQFATAVASIFRNLVCPGRCRNSAPAKLPEMSEREKVRLLFGQRRVDAGDVGVGDPLQVVFRPVPFVFSRLFFANEFADVGYGIAANVADGDPGRARPPGELGGSDRGDSLRSAAAAAGE